MKKDFWQNHMGKAPSVYPSAFHLLPDNYLAYHPTRIEAIVEPNGVHIIRVHKDFLLNSLTTLLCCPLLLEYQGLEDIC